MSEIKLYCGDCLEILPTLAAGSVQCCVTSPPYWGLRDYGTAKWEGGDPNCNHEVQRWDGPKQTQGAQSSHASKADRLSRNRCHRCGATRIDNQIGLECSPDEYVEKLVQVFREVKRVLRDDGTLWLNLGDSYFGDSPARKKSSEAFSDTWDKSQTRSNGGSRRSAARIGDLKPKDLVGIPWMVAFALRADGWYLRSDIIWHKPNPMPESVTDRPTKSHEYLFLLAKSDRYFYDAEAVKEPNSPTSGKWGKSVPSKTGEAQGNGRHGKSSFLSEEIPHDETIDRYYSNGRNRRSVWTIATRPYSGAHFAVFPPALVEPCIKAGSSERGCCPACGKAWERVTEGENPSKYAADSDIRDFNNNGRTANPQSSKSLHRNGGGVYSSKNTTGWQPACSCPPHDPIPCTVLDPFAGSGTAGAVALELGRSFTGIELNPKYIDLIRERVNGVQVVMPL